MNNEVGTDITHERGHYRPPQPLFPKNKGKRLEETPSHEFRLQ